MHWVRKNCRLGSWAALFALCIQLALSFGHIHLEDIQASPTTAAAQLQDQAGGPADDDHGKPEHDFCAICAALSSYIEFGTTYRFVTSSPGLSSLRVGFRFPYRASFFRFSFSFPSPRSTPRLTSVIYPQCGLSSRGCATSRCPVKPGGLFSHVAAICARAAASQLESYSIRRQRGASADRAAGNRCRKPALSATAPTVHHSYDHCSVAAARQQCHSCRPEHAIRHSTRQSFTAFRCQHLRHESRVYRNIAGGHQYTTQLCLAANARRFAG